MIFMPNIPAVSVSSPLSVQLAAPRWQKYPRAAFALLTRAHTHTRTDSGACPVPADRWNRRSDASTPPAALMDAAGHRCCQRALRSKRRWQMEPWNPCDRFFREPRATAANERSRPLLPLSLSRSLSVSRYSAGNKLVFSQPSGPRIISWPSIPSQHRCNRCIYNRQHLCISSAGIT